MVDNDNLSDAEAAVAAEEVKIEKPVAAAVGDQSALAPSQEESAFEPAPSKEAPRWAMERIHEETNRRIEEASRRQAIERENRDLRAVLDRLQKGELSGKAAPQKEPAPSPDRYREDVRSEAARLNFQDDTVAVRNAGLAAFPNFGETLRILNALGVTTDDDCVLDIIATAGRDQAHVLLDRLAKDPEKAASFAKLGSRSRVSQLTRMMMAEQTGPAPKQAAEAATPPKAAAISKAPAPKPRINPSGSQSDNDDWMSDDATDEQFHAGWKKKYKA